MEYILGKNNSVSEAIWYWNIFFTGLKGTDQLGAVHKWHHPILDLFGPLPFPLCKKETHFEDPPSLDYLLLEQLLFALFGQKLSRLVAITGV